jgi:hypothetical protein
MLTAGGLGFTGILVTLLSWLLTGSIRLAVITGFGVFLGFFLGFAVLFVGTVLWFNRGG